MRQQSRFLCCGDPAGKVELRDPLTLKVEHSLETHSASLSDFDVHGNLLVTCGFSNRQGALSCDTLLLVFDLRMLRAVAPINVLLDPLLLRFMPSFSSRLAVASPTGQLQFVETVVSEPDMTLYQVNWPSAGCVVSSLDVCSSSQAVVVGGSGGSLHLMSSNHSPLYNAFSRPTEFADPLETYDPLINLDDTMAILAAIPLPLIDGPLLSDWPKQFVARGYRRTPPINPEILKTMKMQGTVGYAPNPNTRRRNQVSETYTRRLDGGRGGTPSVAGSGEDQAGFVAIPKRYRKPDIKYNKAGGQLLEGEADIDHYSKSGLSGLEATLPNSYCNAMLQVLYFTEGIRTVMLAHQCSGEFCVCCELGFLFHMLGSGAPCHSGNLLRALRSAKEASALRLILSDTSAQDANLLLLIQSWNRFILHQMHSELLETKRKEAKIPSFVYRDTDFPCIELQNQRKKRTKSDMTEEIIEDTSKGETEVSWLFGSRQTHIFTCLKCNNKSSKEATLLVHNLIYPQTKGENNEASFCQVLEMSVGGSQVTPAWCEPCHKFQPTLQERKVKTLPPVLSVNCGNNNESDKKFWKDQMDAVVLKVLQGSGDLMAPSNARQCRYGSACTRVGCRFKHPQQMTELGISVPSHLYQSHSWVPLTLSAALSSSGQLTISSNSTAVPTDSPQLTYNLYAVVCYVNDEKKNIIAIINVAPAHHTPMWYIFNDFSITPVGGHEAVWFSMDWKVPCVLYWRQSSVSSLENEFGVGDLFAVTPPAISPEVLINVPKCATIIPLSPTEIPKQGDLVAIDAEFVTLNQEESELRSDGKLATVKPSHMSVARISCVRGQGPLEGTAFIDDYISTQEQVYDYLTKFSGIKPGDLDATCSSKNLTTLKSTYLKLRYLIDNGVIFVGHGLNNDFRVINVVVPPGQIIDTVQLYYLPHQRMVSLRFLAWHFIGIKIQSETHDSIEDARAALRLYKKYLELEAQGILQSSLEEMYTVGKSLHWKVPGVETH
ncbi:PAN2-PAN3 deadenylation complex catalytic subunit PAN2 isoform X2 [Rhodnius prolixus]